MRQVLQSLGTPDHVGLAYTAWAPVGDDGKLPDAERAGWLSGLANITVSPDYSHAFDRWKASFQPPRDRHFELKLASRLLIGHGNSSATDVGITVHHSWGTPVIPGSALKGLLAHYVDAVYGPDDPSLPQWEQPDADRARADYQGVIRRDSRIVRGPGAIYRALFGAPDAEDDDAMRERGVAAGASAGFVTFHDALYVPGSSSDDRPFAVDVLTVHQKAYYDSAGESWPNDYDSPNPVSFLTVRPGVRMLFALSGPADWTELAEQILRDALERWGVGGKTSSGYGRLVTPESVGDRLRPAADVPKPVVLPRPGEWIDAHLLEERTRKGGWKAQHPASGLSGPIQNSHDVPAGQGPGETLQLIVAIANDRELAFRYPTPADEARTQRTSGKRTGGHGTSSKSDGRKK
jgi:CRISPR-associated protein Cmr6